MVNVKNTFLAESKRKNMHFGAIILQISQKRKSLAKNQDKLKYNGKIAKKNQNILLSSFIQLDVNVD